MTEPQNATDHCGNHPVWSIDAGGWRLVRDLMVGEAVISKFGKTKVVKRQFGHNERKIVWNLEVKTRHNYLVGKSGILVHNSYLNKAATPEAVRKIKKEIKAKNPHASNEELNEQVAKLGLQVADKASTQKKQLTWPEVRALFERGNNFNRKARDENWYIMDEVTVIHPQKKYPNGHRLAGQPRRFRLDSYDPGSIRVSRKATDFNSLNETTWRSYLAEIDSKYPEGAKIVRPNSPVHNGTLLSGDKIIEIPDSNLGSSRKTFFEKIAEEFNVTVKYSPE